MDSILSLNNLTKIYNDKTVVDNASFEIKKGTVCGLLGPNGAGKTTIMKMIMNQVKCDGGSISYDNDLKIKYLQDVPQFYEFYTVSEYLSFVLDITKYSENKEIRIEEVLGLLNLKEYRDIVIKKLSRGLRQKVGIASVIVDEPDILILDEPVSALDPLGRKEMFDIILSLKGKVTVIFSSHILNDIERVCDHIILINNGKIILNNEIKNVFLDKQVLLVEFKNREDLLVVKENIKYENSFSESVENCLEIYCEDIAKCQKEIFSLLTKKNILIDSISIKKDSLEDIFLKEVRLNG